MIKSSIVKCSLCESKILLRFQMGYYNIPFNFSCPECGVSINGTQNIKNGKLIIYNATEIEEKIDNVDYYGNFSVELPCKKISKFISYDEIFDENFSPFLNSISMFDSFNDLENVYEKINSFLNYKKNIWNELQPLYDLFYNNRIDLLENKFIKFSVNYNIKNKLDAEMAFHQLTIAGMNKLVKSDILKEYPNYANEILKKAVDKNMLEFIDVLKNNISFKDTSIKIRDIYSRFIDNFEKYIVVLMYNLSNNQKKFNKDKYGIFTASFSEFKNFYSDSYELILDLISIPIGLNNIFERNDYNLFPTDEEIKNFKKYFEILKSKRIYLLKDNEKFSKLIKLNRNVRNSIAHFNYEFETNNQKNSI